jgi:hypothetical protein
MARKREFTLEWFKKQGRKGGKLGGPVSHQKMTPEERSEYGRRLVALRKWHPVKPKDEPAAADPEPEPEPAPAPPAKRKRS